MFSKKVNKSSRKEMVDFLQDHFKYVGEFAHNVKLNRLFPKRALFEAVAPLTATSEFYSMIEKMLSQWEKDQDGRYRSGCRWRVGFEGRSDGYLTLTGYSVTSRTDFSTWDVYDLRALVKQVQSFDQLCDDILAFVIDLAENNEVVWVEVPCTRTVKEIRPRA